MQIKAVKEIVRIFFNAMKIKFSMLFDEFLPDQTFGPLEEFAPSNKPQISQKIHAKEIFNFLGELGSSQRDGFIDGSFDKGDFMWTSRSRVLIWLPNGGSSAELQ